MKKKLLTGLMLLGLSAAFGQGYLHQNGQSIVDAEGNNVLLRGLGLGGWMVQEGYMLQTSAFAGPQHEIRQKIEQLIGATNTEAFYQAYRNNGITKADIDWLKAQGFNSVRLPMHYNLYTLPIEQEPVAGQNTWLTEGFERTDQLLQWCADNEMYLILDMHAAPGGQGKDANISDYDDTKPSLWESAANRQKMVALWQQLADRYKNSPWIGGYDLINEPNWAFTGTNQNGCDETSNAPLRQLMVDITAAIRQVDTNHMIIIEGNCWGNNYNGIFPLWDDNMTLSFHKYWNGNTVGDIQGMLNLRNQHNVPLWLGESGENSNVWFRDAIKLVESNNIGWAWWPMKKVESIAGVTAAAKPAGYQQLLDYWTNGGTQPSAAFATTVLMQLAENYKFANVTKKADVIDAMFRQVQTDETIPFAEHTLPGKVFATEYDLGTNNFAYYDTEVATYHSGTGGSYVNWNQGWAGRNDGVDIQTSADAVTNGFHVSHIANGEWLQYTLITTELKAYSIDIRYAGMGGALHLEDQDGRISETITLPSTGNYDTWATVTLNDVLVKAGTNKIKAYFDVGGFNLNYIEFKNPIASAQAQFKVIDAGTNALGDKITVTLNKDLQTGIDFTASNVTLKINGNDVAITEITQLEDNTFQIVPATAVSTGDVVTFSYAGSNIIAVDATVHAVFTNKAVANRVGNVQQISGTIQAESFYQQSGISLENTNDVGGGQNIGYTDAGDYLDYLVNINQAGNYQIEYRHSGQNQTGQVQLQLINTTTEDIQTVSLAPTGGWQTWSTTSATAQLPAGRYYLRILITAPGFNLNWVKFSYTAPDDDNDGVPNDVDLCPDTPANTVVDFNGCTLFTLPANNFALQVTSESCRSANNGTINITSAASHAFVAILTGTGNQTANFTTSTAFNNLQAGNYQLCITLPEAPTYQQCYDLVITEPEDLAVLSRVMAPQYQAELDLYGGENYIIKVNNTVYETSQNSIVINLNPGENNIEVKADRDCQGTYRQKIMLDDTAVVYPNPVNGDVVYAKIPATQNKVLVEVFTLQGARVHVQEFNPQDDAIAVNIGQMAQGVYIMKIASGSYSFNTKIVKE